MGRFLLRPAYLYWLLFSTLISSTWNAADLWRGGGVSGILAHAQSTEDLKCEKNWHESWHKPPVGVSPPLCKFVDELTRPAKVDVSAGGVTTIGMYRIKQKVHRDLPETEFFAYGTSAETASYPGPTLEAKRWVKCQVKWVSHLWGKSMFKVDPTLPYAEAGDEIAVVPHLHGIEGEPASDGHAMAWFTASGKKGPAFVKDTYLYYNEQGPSTLWYHDHAHGLTRLNVHSGLAGMYIVRDPEGSEQYFNTSIPSVEYEYPLVFTDTILNTDGSLYFPSEGVTRFHPVWAPEFFGDVMLVNGKAWPYMNVEQRKYRFRMLNAANARFLALVLNVTKLPNSDKKTPFAAMVTVIGADVGYLATPFRTKKPLVLAPAERLDIVVDFRKFPPGTEIIVTNKAKTPYPNGDDCMPPAKVLLKFVVQATSEEELKASRLRSVPSYLNAIPDLKRSHVQEFRQLTVREFIDEETDSPITALLGGKRFNDTVTEEPETGTVEYWQIINLTEDAHPIHIHLAPFQIVSRRLFNSEGWLNNSCTVPPLEGFVPTPNHYDASLPECWTGSSYAPEPYEAGWKDTVQANPKEVTLLILRFAPMEGGSYPFDPTEEPGYMWHCHILDHEDNEMMRPLKLKPSVCKGHR